MTTQQTNQPSYTSYKARPLFELGQMVATPGATMVLNQLNISAFSLLSRHICGDWGDMTSDDKQYNDEALTDGSRIFSAYQFDTVKFWVITEADRSATTILLPEEY